ncbi:hypothetical protein HAX54_041939 [Datura stramonium]|uniref:Uncharacterized protein n=1 Tax=Datura stramonium TaxID=4076 RepID=A0ABS8SLG2_DATST|nr:hypothetical protein [Datura stramonium]
MKSKSSNKNIFIQILAWPWKVLTKARDCYVNSMTNYTVVNPRTLPRSYSTSHVISSSSSSRSINNNDSEDFRELVRAASARSRRNTSMGDINNNFELNNFAMQQQMPSRKLVTRSCSSVGMSRIDEENPCGALEEDQDVMVKNDLKYPRSKSYGIAICNER